MDEMSNICPISLDSSCPLLEKMYLMRLYYSNDEVSIYLNPLIDEEF